MQSTALRILNAFRTQPFTHSDALRVRLTTTIGAHLLGREDTLESAVKYADIALYAAKSAGRNRLVVFDPQAHSQCGARVA